MAALQKFLVAQASRLCGEQRIYKILSLAPVRRLCHDFRVLKRRMASFG
jgi:hypothetical protein